MLPDPSPGICIPQPPVIGIVVGRVKIKPEESKISENDRFMVPPLLNGPTLTPAV